MLYPSARLNRIQGAYQAAGGVGRIADLGRVVVLVREPERELAGAWASLEGLHLESAGSRWELKVLYAVGWDGAQQPGVALLRLLSVPAPGPGEDRSETPAPGSVTRLPSAWARALGENSLISPEPA